MGSGSQGDGRGGPRAVGHLKNGVSQPVLERAFEYWRNIDKELGERIAAAVNQD